MGLSVASQPWTSAGWVMAMEAQRHKNLPGWVSPQPGHWDGGMVVVGGGVGKGESPATAVKVLPPPAHLLSP